MDVEAGGFDGGGKIVRMEKSGRMKNETKVYQRKKSTRRGQTVRRWRGGERCLDPYHIIAGPLRVGMYCACVVLILFRPGSAHMVRRWQQGSLVRSAVPSAMPIRCLPSLFRPALT